LWGGGGGREEGREEGREGRKEGGRKEKVVKIWAYTKVLKL